LSVGYDRLPAPRNGTTVLQYGRPVTRLDGVSEIYSGAGGIEISTQYIDNWNYFNGGTHYVEDTIILNKPSIK